MPLLPASPRARILIAGTLLAVSAVAVAYQASQFFGAEHAHQESSILLYDLERQVLARYPQKTLPGDQGTAALALFAQSRPHAQPAPGMTLEQLEKSGLQAGWLYRLDADRTTGLYADPRQPQHWVRADSPECQAKLNLWMAKAAAFSGTGTPIPCRD